MFNFFKRETVYIEKKVILKNDAERDSILLAECMEKIDKLIKENGILKFELKNVKSISVKRLTFIRQVENLVYLKGKE